MTVDEMIGHSSMSYKRCKLMHSAFPEIAMFKVTAVYVFGANTVSIDPTT